MSQFTPSAGQCFYVKFNPREKVVYGDMGSGDKVIKVQDGSYKDNIFRCIAKDNTHVVATRIYGGYTPKDNYLFVREDVTFNPVGPEVMKALAIEFSEQGE